MPYIFDRLCRISCLLFAFAGPALGEVPASFEAGREAYDRMDYQMAEKIWLELAKQGEINAQFQLAALYDAGLVVTPDKDTLAFKWYEQAALKGHGAASFNLGNAFKHGRGTFKSDELANFWWQKAADAGVANAQYNLAIQYYRGLGAPRDEEKAVEYFNMAASNGHEKAMALVRDGKVPRLARMPPPEKTPAEAAGSHPGPTPDRAVDRSTPNPAQQQQVPPQNSIPAATKEGQSVNPPRARQGSGHKWLRNQPPDSYTLQIAVASNREAAEAFVTQQNLAGQVKVVTLSREGKTYYYLLMGTFADRDSALDRLARLSTEVKKSKPWPRKFMELQPLASKHP